jgi:hypothetical protein
MTNVINCIGMLQSVHGPALLDISNWDLSKVTNASQMFYDYNTKEQDEQGNLMPISLIHNNSDKYFTSLRHAG